MALPHPQKAWEGKKTSGRNNSIRRNKVPANQRTFGANAANVQPARNRVIVPVGMGHADDDSPNDPYAHRRREPRIPSRRPR